MVNLPSYYQVCEHLQIIRKLDFHTLLLFTILAQEVLPAFINVGPQAALRVLQVIVHL